MEKELKDYGDKNLIKFLKYGFPVDHDGKHGTSALRKNHAGATEFGKHVDALVNKEVKLGATLGPLKRVDFDGKYCISPLNSVPKKDAENRRLILDLSHPDENSVNDGIKKDYYLGEYDKLQFPSVDNLVEQIMKIGKGAKVFKVDLSRAYRQIGIDPADVPLLGFYWNGAYFFDVVLSMGGRNSARSCQKVTSAVVFIFFNNGFFAVNYLDDLGGVETDERAEEAFMKLREIINLFGLQEAEEKASPPATRMTFLGLQVDSILFTLTIPQEKLLEIREECGRWKEKAMATLKEVQTLAGLLNFASRCVKSGRVYLSRILNFLREFKGKNQARVVPIETKQDIDWWYEFIVVFNGVSFMNELHWDLPDFTMASDSCLTGGGAFFQGRFIHWKYTSQILEKKWDINILELLMIVLAVQKWGNLVQRKKLIFNCDNKNAVTWINSSNAKNRVAQACLRRLHFLMGINSIELKANFISGKSNRIPDFLSRWHINGRFEVEFREATKQMSLIESKIEESDLEFLKKEGHI